MKLGSIALAAAAVALGPAAGMAATAPKKPTVPAAAPAMSQLDQGVAAYGRADYATAYRMWRLLADQGNADAQYFLGYMYSDGQGVAHDDAAAVSWWRKAAEQGVAEAAYNLGVRYEDGRGVPQDYVEAHKYYNLAGAAGMPLALKSRETVAAKMTPAQIAEAQRLASAWKPTK